MPWRKWVRVVESDQAPRVRATTNGLFLPVAGAPPEPLGQRIIEMPEQPEATELARDPRSGFVAYVPIGSIAKGEALVTTGGDGRTARCTVCHGADLKGTPTAPGIAGRSASYIVQAAVRHAAGYASDENDEGGSCQADRRRHRQHHGLRVIARYTASMNMSVVHGPVVAP